LSTVTVDPISFAKEKPYRVLGWIGPVQEEAFPIIQPTAPIKALRGTEFVLQLVSVHLQCDRLVLTLARHLLNFIFLKAVCENVRSLLTVNIAV